MAFCWPFASGAGVVNSTAEAMRPAVVAMLEPVAIGGSASIGQLAFEGDNFGVGGGEGSSNAG